MQRLGEAGQVTLTPLQVLEVILKTVLDDRITDEEVYRICTVYHDALMKWFS
jgi:hypothetical protein